MYEVVLTKRAHHEFNKLSSTDQDRVENTLDHLSANPRPAGTRKMHGNIYRVRIGDWRIVYAVFDKDRLVLVGKIARRAKGTYAGVDELF